MFDSERLRQWGACAAFVSATIQILIALRWLNGGDDATATLSLSGAALSLLAGILGLKGQKTSR